VRTIFTLSGVLAESASLDDLSGVSDAARTLLALLLCWLARLSPSRAGLALVYHRVGGAGPGDPAREILAAVSGSVFEHQLRHLRHHYRVVPAGELLDAVRGRRRGQRFPLSITFDDDLASHAREALPALHRAGVTATFFLGGASLREPRPFWWEDLQRAVDDRLVAPDALPHVAATDLRAALERSPKAIFRVAATIERLEPAERDEVAAALRTTVGADGADEGLRAADVQALVAGGCDIGFHTLRHDKLPALTDAALADALRQGREELAAVLGRELDLISYPYGKANERVADAARAADYRLGFTTARRPVTADADPLLLPRIAPAMSVGKTALRLARAVASSAST
jgi:peptidoglycan/xylan/chitin deacetylase (PgdA/CDA1 family)